MLRLAHNETRKTCTFVGTKIPVGGIHIATLAHPKIIKLEALLTCAFASNPIPNCISISAILDGFVYLDLAASAIFFSGIACHTSTILGSRSPKYNRPLPNTFPTRVVHAITINTLYLITMALFPGNTVCFLPNGPDKRIWAVDTAHHHIVANYQQI